MRLRTFTAPDMPSAMKMVKEAMGEDAIIISSEPVNGKSVSVTAALETNDDFIPITVKQPAKRDPVAEDLRFELQNMLRYHNLPELFVAKILQTLSDHDLAATMVAHKIGGNGDAKNLQRLAVEKMLGGFFNFKPLPLDTSLRIMLVGPPGVGKSLTAAKLATKLTVEKMPYAVVTTDNKRAGGVEQLQSFTQILGAELFIAPSRTDLWKQIHALPKKHGIIIDTAGCNPYDAREWDELQSFASLEDVEPVLVLPAGGDSLEAIDMVEIFSTLPIKRILMTRADSTRRFGGVLSAAAAHELAFCQVSNAPGIVDSLHSCDAALLSQFMLRYQQH
jgi:flagellar biosynthesis protein FlhF